MVDFNLSVCGLKLSYSNFSLSNVTFELKNGDILGLIGRSGSGKSTIIKALLGIKKPQEGKILFLVDRFNESLNKHVGYSPQSNSLYPFLTLEENIFTFGKLNRLSDGAIKKRIGPLLKRLNLAHHTKKKINELSGGMQKRADLAAALIHDPSLIILDEPFNGIDISLQRFIWEMLRQLSSEGKIIIVSSHMLADIQKNCNQFGLIEDNTYYNTKQIIDAIKESEEQNFELFLEKVFTLNSRSV